MSILRLLAACAAMTFAAPAFADPVNLDTFLSGFLNDCDQSEEWIAFRTTMVGEDLKLTRRTQIPADIRAGIGRAEIVDRNEAEGTVTVEVPVEGAIFNSLPVKALRLGYARDYPLIDDNVIFATSGDAALAAFADALGRFQKEHPNSIVEYGLHDDPAGPRLTCFVTN